MALLGGLLVPLARLGRSDGDALALVVHLAEVELGVAVALRSCRLARLLLRGELIGGAPAVVVLIVERAFGVDVALRGGLFVQLRALVRFLATPSP